MFNVLKKKSQLASPCGYFEDKIFRGRKETSSRGSDRRGEDEVESRQQEGMFVC